MREFPSPLGNAVRIAPSILSADFSRLGEEIRLVEKAGADWIHVDVMDGHFVPNLTIGPVVVEHISKGTHLPLDVHLMIQSPEKFVPAFAAAGSSLITVHWEACRRPLDVIRLIKKCGCRAGLSLRPKTPIDNLRPYISHLDLILIMTVEPGFGGQKFMNGMLPKIRWARDNSRREKKTVWVEVDGGINMETASLAVGAGADALVAGQAIYGASNPGAALKSLRKSASAVV